MVNRFGYVDRNAGNVYVRPLDPDPTEGTQPKDASPQVFPMAGLTDDGRWIIIKINADGTLPQEGMVVGVPYHDSTIQTITPDVDQELYSEAVPASTVRMLGQVLVVTRVTGSYAVYVDGDLKGSGRTGPGGTGRMPYASPLPIATGAVLSVLFKSRPNAPAHEVECHVQATDLPA